jgi:hypothetical protein
VPTQYQDGIVDTPIVRINPDLAPGTMVVNPVKLEKSLTENDITWITASVTGIQIEYNPAP